jgi:2,3-bisphosphoglycerate-dependent phosphoglycerate mutase/probable phosphoglycerate mutase
MRTSVWLVRHGQTHANREQRYLGRGDSPLTTYGQQQAANVAHRLRRLRFDVALVSPVGRARATAAALLQNRQTQAGAHVSLVDAPEWAEIDHGRWEGLTYGEVREQFAEEAHTRFAGGLDGRAQGGESLREAAQRVADGWETLLRRYQGGRVLVVTHATPIQLVLCTTFDLPPTLHWRWRVDLGSLSCLDVYASATIVRMVNEVPRFGAGTAADAGEAAGSTA